jgi:hypothetical protein
MTDQQNFPELPADGEQEAIKLIESFKEKLKAAADEAIGDLYSDIMPHIESDSWFNFQNDVLSGLKDYSDRKVRARYDFKQIRKQILDEYRSELVEDLNQDHLYEIEQLKKELKFLYASRNC